MTPKPEPRPKPSKRDRYRYVAFRLRSDAEARPSRNAMISAIQGTADEQGLRDAEPWLTRFNGEHGILRCLRGHEKDAVRLLRSIDTIPDEETVRVRVETLSTSGTIASLQRKVLRGVRLEP